MKKILENIIKVLEYPFLPLILLSGLTLKVYRRVGSFRLRLATNLLRKIGVFPILDHYYEPLFNDLHLRADLKLRRDLPSIELNIEKQHQLLKRLCFQEEFTQFLTAQEQTGGARPFRLDNGVFGSGDAEFLFNFVRLHKPRRIVEVGCGASTQIIHAALNANRDDGIDCDHLCIEPYEQPWLNDFSGITLVRERVEDIDLEIIDKLGQGDLLFIDSSHMIRPQGDVLFEYLTMIPRLASGVFIHIHDIFTPYDYPEEWLKNQVRFWNEQYLLEALLTGNASLEVVAALNYLKNENFEDLKKVCTYLTEEREPGSFYLVTR